MIPTIQLGQTGFSQNAQERDAYFANVTLLLHMEGTSGGTTFTDSSTYGRTVTASGNAQITNTGAKFGSGALLLDGTGDYLTAASGPEQAIGTADFTVELFNRTEAFAGSGRNLLTFAGQNWNLFHTSAGLLYFWDGGSYGFQAVTNDMAQNIYYHVALTRASGTVRGFVNGNLVGTATRTTSLTASAVLIGAYPSSSIYAHGRMDAVRMTVGVARYTAAFTPPVYAFPTS